MARTGKNTWSLFLLLLAGIVLGSFIAHLTAGVSALSWLSYGKTFGLSSPIVLDLGVLVLTFGLTIKFTIASIIGIIIAATLPIIPYASFISSVQSAVINALCLIAGVAAALLLDRFNRKVDVPA